MINYIKKELENSKGEIIYPILDVYVDICNGRKLDVDVVVRKE